MNRPEEPRTAFSPVDLAREADFALGLLQVRPSLRRVACNGRGEAVQPRVMQVLVALARARGGVVSREELTETCWDGVVVGDDSITHAIAKLRQLADFCGGAPAFQIETIPRVGYRLTSFVPALEPGEGVPPPDPAAMALSRSKAMVLWVAVASVAVIGLALTLYEVRLHFPSRSTAVPAGASIAVLPFRNLSADKDAGYFAEGVQDEILTRLARIGSLKVISRTSTEEFADNAPNIREIAHRLGVANILEGNVQKSGNRIRINVQLIHAANDNHLWAEDYDRRIGDLFSVESEVAGAIAVALAAKITPGERAEIAARPTDDPRAYELYLRGLVFEHKSDDLSQQTALRLFQQAVAADPKFALAWAHLARMQALTHEGDDPAAAPQGPAHAALAKALELQPDLADVQAAKGFYLYYAELNYPAAERELERVHTRWPNDAEALEALALVSRRLGRWKESADDFDRLVSLDPLVPEHRTDLAYVLMATNDFTRAQRVLDDALRMWPDNGAILAAKAAAYQNTGQLDLAEAALANVHPAPDDIESLAVVWEQFWLKRQFGRCAAYFKGSLSQAADRGAGVTGSLLTGVGECLRMAGDAKGARENYSKARDVFLAGLKAHPNDLSFRQLLAVDYSGLGDSKMAMTTIDRAIGILRASNDAMDGASAAGIRQEIMAASGDRGPAIAELSRLMNVPGSGVTPALARLDPGYDRLRDDPRFEALVRDTQAKPN